MAYQEQAATSSDAGGGAHLLSVGTELPPKDRLRKTRYVNWGRVIDFALEHKGEWIRVKEYRTPNAAVMMRKYVQETFYARLRRSRKGTLSVEVRGRSLFVRVA